MRNFLFRNPKLGFAVIIVLLLPVLLLPVFAGDQKEPDAEQPRFTLGETPPPENTFSGTTADGEQLLLTLDPSGGTVRGFGVLGKRELAVSGPTLWYAPVLFSFDDGQSVSGHLTLTRGHTLEVKGLGEPVVMSPGGAELKPVADSFTGSYANKGQLTAVSLDLEQRGKLLAGRGFVDGQPVAVVARVTGQEQASGTVLFADDSRVRVSISLTAKANVLTITGLWVSLSLERQ